MGINYNNIMKRALMAFGVMFGFLFAAGTAIVWYLGLPLIVALTIAVATVLLQYILGPFLISLIYSIDYESELKDTLIKPEILEFIKKVCAENKLPVPKIGIIEDGNPNAFVYGHFKWDAKLVLTQGLLEILDEEEQKAVIAHELGHIKNNDFILMTLVSLIPLILYQIYIWTHGGNKNDPVYWVGMGAYCVYILSQYFVLGFSRIREYRADNFSRRVLGSGDALKSALVKIAYGFTKETKPNKLKATAFGVANAAQSEAFFLLNYKNENKESEPIKKLMKWDTNNVWGKWYELNSTHPLTAKRILALSDGSFTVERPGIKQYLQFLFELFIVVFPWITFAAIGVISFERFNILIIIISAWSMMWKNPIYFLTLGFSILLSYYYSYSRKFKASSVEELLLSKDASPVKGKPAIIQGKIIGKGIPGLFCSEDIVLDDGTGIILVDYRQPLKILQFLFGCIYVDKITEQNAKIIGWYKRANRPYFACRHIIVEGKKYRSYSYFLRQLLGYSALLLGLGLMIIRLF